MRDTGARTAEIEALYRERFRAFLLSATALLRDRDTALDVVQDAFGLALRRRRSFRRDGNLEAWVWRIMLNKAQDRLRARQRELRSVPLRLVPEAADDDHEELKACLFALPERQRLAVFLRYYADLSYVQIAELLGVSPGTIAASLNHAHGALLRQLEEVAR